MIYFFYHQGEDKQQLHNELETFTRALKKHKATLNIPNDKLEVTK
jgi:hypothetical protein